MKKAFYTAAGAAALVGAALLLLRERGPRYNLLLITMDTTRADRIGCYGYGKATTPGLDALARSGLRFTRAFSNVPLTLPSHATMMTGLYPPEHGCRVNGASSLAGGITTLAEEFASHGYRTAAFVAAFVLDSRFGINRGFQTYDDFEVPDAEEIYDENVMYRYRSADRVTDAALSWLEKRSRRPFFCWVHYFDPHRPYYLNQPFFARYKDAPYDAEIAFMDSQIGRLLDYLKMNDLLEITVIVAIGDHGESLGEHGEDEHGLLLYNGSMRVPLIVSCPGRLPEGREAAAPVSGVDLFPTILELFGWTPPGRTSGRSFAAVLSGRSVPDRPFYAETEFPLTEYGWSPLSSLTAEGWKYIRAPREELYDLSDDPGETKNLARARPKKLERLRAALKSVEDGMQIRESSKVAMDEASRRALESLGYLGGGGAVDRTSATLRDPKDAVWMRLEFIKAAEEIRAGRIAEAEETLRRLISESPESYVFRYRLARMFYDRREFEKALPEFEEIVTMVPDEYRSHYNLGKTLMKLGRLGRAIDEFRTALEFDKGRTNGWNNLGIAFLKTGRIEEAMETFRTSISIKDEQVDPHNNLGNAYLSLGKVDEATKEFRRAVEIKPDFLEGRYNLGLCLLSAGDYRGAAEQLRHAVRLRPSFAAAHRKLGIALTRAGRIQEGLRAFSRAREALAEIPAGCEPNRGAIGLN